MTAPAGLGRGERAPDLVLASRDGTPTRYYAQAGGRPALLVFADEGCVARLHALAEGLTAIGDKDLTVHVVGPPALAGHDLAFPLLQDADGRAVAAYRTGGAPTAFLLDPNLRVRATLPFADGARVAADVAELVAELVWDDRRPPEITTQAPLLVVPDVLDPEQCAELIAVWEQQGHSQTGVESSTGGGRAEQHNAQLEAPPRPRRGGPAAQPRAGHHDRSSGPARAVQGVRVPGEPLRGLQDRLLPGVRPRVLQRPPRQPQSRDRAPSVRAHPQPQRRLPGRSAALPRVRPELYRPAAGAGLLFSCSHLHEVLEVTAGRRFVLLSFLFGDEAPRPE